MGIHCLVPTSGSTHRQGHGPAVRAALNISARFESARQRSIEFVIRRNDGIAAERQDGLEGDVGRVREGRYRTLPIIFVM
jgi:hypothetical protein